MSPDPNLNKTDKEPVEAKTLSIQVEPSPPLILAVSQLLRSYGQPNQAIELCRHGLTLFPGDLGLKLGLALGYGELLQKEKAWAEIKGVALELHQLSPVLEKIAKYSGQNGQTRFSEWFIRLSQVLAQYPVDAQETINPPKPAKADRVESLAQEDPSGPPPEGELISESNVLSTLNDWLSQLKREKD